MGNGEVWMPVADGEVTYNMYRESYMLDGADLDLTNPPDNIRLCQLVPAEAQDAAQIPALDTEREIIEAMAYDWLERFEPGDQEWSDAQVIRAWLDNYRGTIYDEVAAQDAAQGSVPREHVETIRDSLLANRMLALNWTNWDEAHKRRVDAALVWLASIEAQEVSNDG